MKRILFNAFIAAAVIAICMLNVDVVSAKGAGPVLQVSTLATVSAQDGGSGSSGSSGSGSGSSSSSSSSSSSGEDGGLKGHRLTVESCDYLCMYEDNEGGIVLFWAAGHSAYCAPADQIYICLPITQYPCKPDISCIALEA